MWNQASLEQLEVAIAGYDRPETERLCAELTDDIGGRDEPFPAPEAKKIMNLLRRKRFFAAMRRVGDALLQAGQTAASIRRLHAQAVIEEGDLTAAIGLLESLIRDSDKEPAELAEAKGLLGRALKQRYVNTAGRNTPARRKTLNDAVEAYWRVYEADPIYTWHGINAVACDARARRDGVSLQVQVDPNAASKIIAAIEKKTPDTVAYWDLATAAEACVALGEWQRALDFYKSYIADKSADAFEIGSTLRQLREVWQLGEAGETGERADLIAVLKAALLGREGGGIDLAGREMAPALEGNANQQREQAFEKTFGGDGFRTYQWFTTGQTRARAVGRVEDRFGRGMGTGFLVRAADFVQGVAKDSGQLLFLTNAHVVGETNPRALRPADAVVRFESVDNNRTFPIDTLLWESASDALDATLMRLQDGIDLEPCPIGPPEEPMFIEGAVRKLYVIGYPRGGTLALSLDDNRQVGWRRPLLHYRTPTEPGSSGSPVLDDQWRVVALHHAGKDQMPRLDDHPGFYQANEGIWIHDIVQGTRLVTLPPSGPTTTAAGVTVAGAGAGAAAERSDPGKGARKGVFISYSHKDGKWLGELKTFLSPRLRNLQLRAWADTDIKPGADWRGQINEELGRAAVAVLLVSADFIASNFIATVELPSILTAAKKEGLSVFWIAVQPSDYQSTPLNDFQAANDPGRPLNTLSRPARQQKWVDIVQKISAIPGV